MNVKDCNKKKMEYINSVYKNLTLIRQREPGYVVNSQIYDFVTDRVNCEKYGLEKEKQLLIRICEFENGYIDPSYTVLKQMVAAAKKAEKLYKQHKVDLKLHEIEKDFV